MKKLLITGFEPFGGETINPSWDAVSSLPENIGEYTLTKLRLPVVFEKSATILVETAEKLCPDFIISVGQAGGRSAITPEYLGINLRNANTPDNDGNQPKDERIFDDGQDAYFSTIPVRKIAENIKNNGIDAQVSYSAGTFVCNDVLYTLLSRFKGTTIKVGFIHVPYSTDQGKEPSMSLDDIVKGLTIAIKTLED